MRLNEGSERWFKRQQKDAIQQTPAWRLYIVVALNVDLFIPLVDFITTPSNVETH